MEIKEAGVVREAAGHEATVVVSVDSLEQGLDLIQQVQTFLAGGKAVSAPAKPAAAPSKPAQAAPAKPTPAAAPAKTAAKPPVKAAPKPAPEPEADPDDEFAEPAAASAEEVPSEIAEAKSFREVMEYLIKQGTKDVDRCLAQCEAWRDSCQPIAKLGTELKGRIERALEVLLTK